MTTNLKFRASLIVGGKGGDADDAAKLEAIRKTVCDQLRDIDLEGVGT